MIPSARARWRRVLLVCAKCEKKLGGGFGAEGDKRLSKLLRKHAGGKGRKADLGVVATGCLKLCPHRAVTVVDADRPGAWLAIPAGTEMREVCERLALDVPGAASRAA